MIMLHPPLFLEVFLLLIQVLIDCFPESLIIFHIARSSKYVLAHCYLKCHHDIL